MLGAWGSIRGGWLTVQLMLQSVPEQHHSQPRNLLLLSLATCWGPWPLGHTTPPVAGVEQGRPVSRRPTSPAGAVALCANETGRRGQEIEARAVRKGQAEAGQAGQRADKVSHAPSRASKAASRASSKPTGLWTPCQANASRPDLEKLRGVRWDGSKT